MLRCSEILDFVVRTVTITWFDARSEEKRVVLSKKLNARGDRYE